MLNNRVFSVPLIWHLAQYALGTVVYAVLILLGFGGTALADHNPSISEYEPEIKSVSIISQPLSISLGDSIYGVGEVIKVQVTFFWPVIVNTTNGTPRVELNFQNANENSRNSSTIEYAQYTSGSGNNSLEFHYTVASNDADNDGVEVQSPVELNSGTITDADSENSATDLTFINVSASRVHRVNGNGYNDDLEPTIASDGILITSTPLVGTTYGVGEVIKIKVLFLRPVKAQVTNLQSQSRPKVQLRFQNTSANNHQTRFARYASGSGSKGLEFHYEVESNVEDNDGFKIRDLKLNSKNLTDTTTAVSISDDIDFPDVYGGTDHKVNGSDNNRVPKLLSSGGISIISAPYNDTAYSLGEVITVQAEFLRPVTVTGTPKVRLKFCAGPCNQNQFRNVHAEYTSGSDSKKLEFRYTVQSGDIDNQNGFEVRSPIKLREGQTSIGTITDTVTGEEAPSNISFTVVYAGLEHNVNGNNQISSFPPRVRSVDIISTPGISTNYGLGDIIKVWVQLFRPVTVDVTDGTPSMQLELSNNNSRTVDAQYVSGSGSDELEYHYTVGEDDTASNAANYNSIELLSPIYLNGGIIKDEASNISANGNLVFSNKTIAQTVDYSQDKRPTTPTVTGISLISTPQVGTTYGLDEVIKVQINFLDPVVVDTTNGTPSVVLGPNMDARYHSGSDALEFHYTVQSNDNNTNGIEVNSPVELNGGTIQNQSGGDSAGSDLAFHNIPANTNHKVDGSQDNLGPGVSLSVSPNSIDENALATTVTVTATLENTTTQAMTVTLSLSGTAIDGASSGDDYTASWNPSNKEVVIAGGSLSGTATVTISPNDDSVYENDETIVVNGISSLGGDVSSATVTLAENEAKPAVTLSVSPSSVAEDGATTTVTVTVGLESAVASPTRVQLEIADESTATLTDDYTVTYEPVSRRLTIPAGDTTCPDKIEVIVTPVDNSFPESTETIVIGGTTSNNLTVTPATVTLTDNDDVPVTLSVDDATLAEGENATTITVTAETDLPLLEETTFALSLGGSADEAEDASNDYTATPTADERTLTISSGSTTGTLTLTITPNNDSVYEGDETIIVSGSASASGFTVTPVTITLTDDDVAPTFALLALPSIIQEGASATTVTVTATRLGNETAQDITITLNLSPHGTAEEGADKDYTATWTDQEITIAAGSTSGTATVTITPIEDSVPFESETIIVVGTATGGLTVTSATVWLIEASALLTVPATLSVDDHTIAEGENATTITVTVEVALPLSGDSNFELSLGGTATSGDYSVSDTQPITVTVSSDNTTGTTTLTLTPNNDIEHEGDESIAITVSSSYNVNGAPVSFSVSGVTVTLLDNDVELKVEPTFLSEDAGTTYVTVTATLPGEAPATATTVTLSLGGSATQGTDYNVSDKQPITIDSGNTIGTTTLTITPVDDDIGENVKYIEVSGSTSSGFTVTPVTITLTDDDGTLVTLSVSPNQVTEDGGAQTVTVMAETAKDLLDEITFALSLGGSATQGADYNVSDMQPITISNDNTGTTTLTLTPNNDSEHEGNETIILTSILSGYSVSGVTVTLLDNDVELKVEPTFLSEDAGTTYVTVTATLPGEAPATATTVTLSLGGSADEAEDASNDYTATPTADERTLTISSGSTTGTLTLTITPNNDSVYEGDETIIVSGSASASGFTVTPVTITLTDDDDVPAVTLSVSPNQVTEDGGAQTVTVTAELKNETTRAMFVTLSLSGTAMRGTDIGDDYSAVWNPSLPNPPQISIAGGNTIGTVTVTITPNNDSVYENDKTIVVNGISSLTGDNSSATVTLTDNDAVRIEQPTITSNPNNGDTFQLGEAIEVAMVFPEIVYVDTSGGTPTITLSFGTASSGSGKPALTMLTAANEEERLASYVSGSGTRELVFAYIVAAEDYSATGISVMPNSLSFNGGMIQDEVGNPVETTHARMDMGYKVNGGAASPDNPDDDNTPPELPSHRAIRKVAENTPAGRNVGDAVTASDADGDAVIYSLSGDDAAFFSIDATTGQLTVGKRVVLDYESDKIAYGLMVTADDGYSGETSLMVTVLVTDVDEPPDKPKAPTVVPSSINGRTTLAISWIAPQNTGPAIIDYDVAYRLSGASEWTDAHYDGLEMATVLTGLAMGTACEVRVRASNAEGTGQWSDAGIGSTTANTAPAFPSESVTHEVREHTPVGETVGDAMTASDADNDVVTYSLSGDAAFAIDATTGQLTVGDGGVLNYESETAYTLIVMADDGYGGIDSLRVRVSLQDMDEPPGKPEAPTVVPSSINSRTTLAIGWPAPQNTGPTIGDYDVAYRLSGTSEWTDAPYDGVETATVLTGLAMSTTYEIRVRASNAEGTGQWSDAGIGRTDANTAPAFLSESVTHEVREHTRVGQTVGDAMTASDADNDALTYSLSGDDAAGFAIDATTGQLTVGDGIVLNYENETAYTLMVMADDGHGDVDSLRITVTVTDVDEPPDKPEMPTMAPASINGRTTLAISWLAPQNTGPAIGDYDVAYRLSGISEWTDTHYEGVETATVLTGLAMSTVYEVQVRASNAEGTGQWSDAGIGRTNANTAPVFSSDRATREVAENTPAGESVGDALIASDADGDVVTYSLSGDDAAFFSIDAATGQLIVGDGIVLDYESETTTYALKVMADDGYGGVGSLKVTVIVTDVDEPPGKPEAPTVVPSSINGRTTLAIGWIAPDNTGPAIIDYDVAYRVSGASEWTDAPYDGVETATLLTGLAMGTAYEVRVRASNDEGTGQWSDAGTGSTHANISPVFPSDRATHEVAENTRVGQTVGDAVTASDADNDAVTYSLSTNESAFAIDAATGQLTVGDRAVLDYESETTTYALMVRADDGYGGVDSLRVTVIVTDVDEPPDKPEAPTIVPANTDGDMTLAIGWTVPDNTGPAIIDYDVAYRLSGTTEWMDTHYDGVETTSLLPGLTASTAYEVRVRASNDEGTGQWSDAGMGNTAIARPDAPVNLTAHPGDGDVTLTWDDPQNATITAYEYRLDADTDWIDIPGSHAQTTQHTVTGLVNGTVYTFALRAVNSTAAGQAVEVIAMPVVLVNVSFEADNYTAGEGREGVRIAVMLDNVADREILLPIASEVQAGTEVEDYTLSGLVDGVLPIAIGARGAHFTVTAERDADREDERVVLSFGDLPVQVRAGVPSHTTVLLADLDKAVAARLKTLNQAILPEVARAMTASAMDAITNRLDVAMTGASSQRGKEISIGGYPLTLGAPTTLPELPDPLPRDLTHKRQRDDSDSYRQENPMQILTRSSFVLPVNVGAHPNSTPRAVRDLTLWGSGTYRNLNSNGAIDWHGDLFGGHIGADARVGNRGLAGVLLSFFKGSFTYSDQDIQTGAYENQMLSVYPYVGWSSQSGLRVWASGGLGTGELGIDGTAYQVDTQSSAMSQRTLAGGASGFVLSHGATTLRLKGEAWMTHVGLDARGLIDALTVDVQRTRLALEGSHGRTLSSGGQVTQVLELGLRYDRGDGITGGGIEIGGGLRYVNASGVWTIEGRGRSLLVHQADYREWGASGLMTLNPGGNGGGLSLRLAPVYGQAQSGINQLYDSEGIRTMTGGQNRQSQLDAQVGYGWSPRGGGMLRPYIGLSLSRGASHRYLAGWCFEAWPALSISLEAEHDDHAFGLRLQGRLSY